MKTSRIIFWRRWIATLLLAGIMSTSAVAWVKFTTDSGHEVQRLDNNMTLDAYTGSFPPTGTRRDSLIRTKNKMEDAPSDFDIDVDWSSAAPRTGNSRDEIWYTTDSSLLSGRSAACINESRSGLFTPWHIAKSDIVLDQNGSWINNPAYLNHNIYGGHAWFTDTALMHELGHALGLDHEDRYCNVMGDSWRYCTLNTCPGTDQAEAYAGEDAGVGLVSLYGPSTHALKEDLSVSHWRYCGSDGQYSIHCFSDIDPVTTSAATSDSWYGEMPRYNLEKGETYSVQFTFENNGLYPEYVIDVAYVISTNDKISTHDNIIKTRHLALLPNTPKEEYTEMTIPLSLRSGTYFLGVIIDSNDVITEWKETNNTSFIPIKISSK